jgi:DNA repair exonuclease SbcCD ATPase subunit
MQSGVSKIMPENVVNFFSSFNNKIQDTWYWVLFSAPFLIGVVAAKGKNIMEPEHSFKWNISIIITIAVLAFGGFRSFVSLEKDMEELQEQNRENGEMLKRLEKRDALIATNHTEIEHTREKFDELIATLERQEKNFIDMLDKIYDQREKDKEDWEEKITDIEKLSERKLDAAVEQGAKNHKTMQDQWNADIARNRGEVEKLVSELSWRQNVLWNSNQKGERFTAMDGEKQAARDDELAIEIRDVRNVLNNHIDANANAMNALNGRLTRLFQDIENLSTGSKPAKNKNPLIWGEFPGFNYDN